MNPTITFPIFGEGFSLNIPRYFTIFGFNIYYYALCIVLAYGLAALYVIKRRKLFNLTTDNVLDILLIAVPCGIIGARIYYMLFNFSDFFGPGKWENILKFRDGGLAVYGGIIVACLVCFIYSRRKKIAIGNILDAGAFGLLIGQAVGRWGNFINVEAYGVETDLPWKMGISTLTGTTYHHPTFLYESLWNIGGLLIMHIFSKRYKTNYPGQYFLFYVSWYGLGRFMIEGLRTDSLYIPNTDFRVSQVLAALSFAVALTLLISNRSKTPDDSILQDSGDAEEDEDDVNDDTDDNNDINDAQQLDDIEDDNLDELAAVDGAADSDIENEKKTEKLVIKVKSKLKKAKTSKPDDEDINNGKEEKESGDTGNGGQGENKEEETAQEVKEENQEITEEN